MGDLTGLVSELGLRNITLWGNSTGGSVVQVFAGMHPELVRRLVALGLLEVTRDTQGRLWFDPSQVREMARIQRLRMSLNLGYSAIGLVVDLLDRIAELEKAQRRMSRRGGAPWT